MNSYLKSWKVTKSEHNLEWSVQGDIHIYSFSLKELLVYVMWGG